MMKGLPWVGLGLRRLHGITPLLDLDVGRAELCIILLANEFGDKAFVEVSVIILVRLFVARSAAA